MTIAAKFFCVYRRKKYFAAAARDALDLSHRRGQSPLRWEMFNNPAAAGFAGGGIGLARRRTPAKSIFRRAGGGKIF